LAKDRSRVCHALPWPMLSEDPRPERGRKKGTPAWLRDPFPLPSPSTFNPSLALPLLSYFFPTCSSQPLPSSSLHRPPSLSSPSSGRLLTTVRSFATVDLLSLPADALLVCLYTCRVGRQLGQHSCELSYPLRFSLPRPGEETRDSRRP
jgi:hypothetical protein